MALILDLGLTGGRIIRPTFHAPFDDPDDPLKMISGGALTMVRAGATATFLHPTTGLITAAAANILRIEANGALIEGVRTNLALQSQTLGTTWTPTDITVSDNDGVSPDGATNAELLTATAGNGTLIQDLGVVASAAKVYSIWLKRKTGTGNIDLTLDNGGTWTTKTITTSWVRYEITATVADPDVGVRIVTDADAIWAWGGQLEDSASLASSYIPTVASSVTRNADDLSFAVSGNLDETVGTLYLEYDQPQVAAQADKITDGTNALFNSTTDDDLFTDQLNTLTYIDSLITVDTVRKVAMNWTGSILSFVADGGAVETATFDGNLSLGANIDIGSTGGLTALFGHVKNLRIWDKAFSNARMIEITS